MRSVFLISFIIFALFISCSKEPTEPAELYDVRGKVYYNGLPKDNASVAIDNKLNWTVLTDADGSFEITGVSAGNHVLKSTITQNDGSFSERSTEIALYSDIELDNLILPKAVKLFDLFEITSNSVSMKWSRSNASDFREYKIYRHTTSGLDETTGTLTHVSTSVDDTTFTDTDLLPFEKYYYRIYVMNEYGRLGGSNIVSTTTEKYNILKNADFEIIDLLADFPEYWNNYDSNPGGTISIDTLEVKNGQFSIKFSVSETADGSEFFMTQDDINPSYFNPGSRYKLYGCYRVNRLGDNISFQYLLTGNSAGRITNGFNNTHPSQENVWEQFKFEFTIPSGSTASNYRFYLCLIKWTKTTINMWIDDVRLEKID